MIAARLRDSSKGASVTLCTEEVTVARCGMAGDSRGPRARIEDRMGKFSFPSFLSGPVARGSLISLAVSLTGLALATLQAILTARLLGPEGYGIVAYVLSLVMIFAMVALLGTHTLAVREVAKHQKTGDAKSLAGFIRTCRAVALAASVCVSGLWILGTWFFAEHFFPIGFVALLFPVVALTLQSQSMLQGWGVVALAQAPNLVLRPFLMVSALTVTALTSLSITPVSYLTTALFAALLAMTLAWIIVRKRTRDLPIASGYGFARLGRSAAPFFMISVIALLMGEINTLMLTWWAGAEETGLFQPIARVTPVLMLGMQSVAVRFGPRVSEFWTSGEIDRLQALTRQVTLASTGFTMLAAAALVLFGEWILGLFGAAFVVNASALIWVAGAQIFNAACGPVNLLLTMSDKAGAAVWPRIIALLVNVALGTALIPAHGALGAAIAMSGGIVAWNIAMLIAVRRRLNFDPSLWGVFRPAR